MSVGTFVVYEKSTTKIVAKVSTLRAAKSFLTTFVKRGAVRSEYEIASYGVYVESIEKMVTRKNLMTGKEYQESVNTTLYLSPASETYWSM